MNLKPSLESLVNKLTGGERRYLNDLLQVVSRNARTQQSYPDALTVVLRGAITRAASDRPIKERSEENAPIGEVNHAITVLVAMQSELINRRLQRCATESYQRESAIWQEMLVELGLGDP